MKLTAPAAWVRRWRRLSLRLRVTTVTMGLGIGLGVILGTVLFEQVAQGLVRQAVREATADAGQHMTTAQDQLGAIELRDTSSLNTAVRGVMELITPATGTARYAALSRGLDNDRSTVISDYASSNVQIASLPGPLYEAIEAETLTQQVMVVEVSLEGAERPMPSVLVGARVDIPRAGPYDLVLIYPMIREQATLDLVRQWFLVGGAGLVLLLGGIAYLATRLVTAPVGRAVKVTHQLALGDLDRRLPVVGSNDELDRLAASFNSMADSLQQQIRQLETLSMLQQRFVSDVSHELRTPLTTIRMASDVLHASREEFSGPVARSTELLQGELDRFEDLLTELLEISRYDSGAAVLEVEQVDLHLLTSGVVAGFAVLSERTGTEVRVQAPPGEVQVCVDPRRVARILRNLIGNAVEHGEGHPVDVRILEDDTTVSIRVRDYGVGLSPEEAEQVFERFWRADTARTRTTGGTGLGLSISLEDARLHGGWLQVAGERGAGACFQLTLPREPGTTVPEPQPPRLTRAARLAERQTSADPDADIPPGATAARPDDERADQRATAEPPAVDEPPVDQPARRILGQEVGG